MKHIFIVFLIFGNWIGYSQYPVRLSDEYKSYRLILRDIEINIAMSDSLFHYVTYQEMSSHYATGKYQLNSDGSLELKMDTLKTISAIRAIDDSKFIYPPKFNEIKFKLMSDTIYCTYRYSGKDKVYKVPLAD